MTVTSMETAEIVTGIVHDDAGNANEVSTSTDNSVVFATGIKPTVTINVADDQVDPTNQSPIIFKVEFSSIVTDFTDSDISLSGTAGADTAVVTGSGKTYEVAVSGMTQSGTVIAEIPSDSAIDIAGLGNELSTSTDNIVSYDIESPKLTINQAAAQNDPVVIGIVHFTLVSDKEIADMDSSKIAISGTAGANNVVVTGNGTVFDVAVSGMIQGGTVIVSVPVGVCHDLLGNPNQSFYKY